MWDSDLCALSWPLVQRDRLFILLSHPLRPLQLLRMLRPIPRRLRKGTRAPGHSQLFTLLLPLTTAVAFLRRPLPPLLPPRPRLPPPLALPLSLLRRSPRASHPPQSCRGRWSDVRRLAMGCLRAIASDRQFTASRREVKHRSARRSRAFHLTQWQFTRPYLQTQARAIGLHHLSAR